MKRQRDKAEARLAQVRERLNKIDPRICKCMGLVDDLRAILDGGAEQCPTCKMPRYQYLRLTPGHPTPCPDSFHATEPGWNPVTKRTENDSRLLDGEDDDWVARDYPGAHDTGGRKINEPLLNEEDK